MPLPTPNLDDLRFQRDLVDEARRRIIRYCPEWTDYNLSDPGITLIELFAWMTEMMVYRLNRIPEKSYIKFMELLGIQLQPAGSAHTELTFWLSAPFPLGPEDDTITTVPQGIEVSTWSTEEEPAIIFTTDEKLVLRAPKLTQLRREADLTRNYLPRLGIEDFYAFNRDRPQIGDTFYLGFDESQDLCGYVLQLAFECRETEGVGIRREDPPLIWECSLGNGQWQEIAPSSRRSEQDTTGGLNNARGRLVLYLPLTIRPDLVQGRNAYWVRCRFEPRRSEQGTYNRSPRIINVSAYAVGATTTATHATVVREEALGRSSGEPGQIFNLQHAPVLALGSGETIEVEEDRDGEMVFIPWQRVPDFSRSDRHSRHFVLDEATGEIGFGLGVRQPDGTVHQYGRVPETGFQIRMSQYRHGGGVIGNVPAGKLQVLRSAIPYVDRVSNLYRAIGGRDQESLEEARLRAQREVRAQQRAVTAEDYENLGRVASRRVARVKCNAPGQVSGTIPPGMIDLIVVPAAFDALRLGDRSRLVLDEALIKTVRAHLDQYRLLTTTLNIREPHYLGIKVQAQIVLSEYHRAEPVVARVREFLDHFVSPLALETQDEPLIEFLGPEWEGWPFGRDLYVSEIYSLIQQVPGVKHVLDVKLGSRPVMPSRERPPTEQVGQSEDEEKETIEVVVEQLAVSDQRVIQVPPDTLVCSLGHEIQVVTL
ncbi:MAG: putative baseplate assembly protein [Anaerolineae bacterium]|nr:putative baseplate assembly protein [Anaerolineae bacterium]